MILDAGACFETGNYKGNEIEWHSRALNVKDAIKCEKLCQENSECKFWTFNPKNKICYLQKKNVTNDKDTCPECTRGPKFCINPWKPIGGKVYQLISEPKSFDDAAKHCIQIRGKLFEPRTEKENNDVMKFLNLAALCSGWQHNRAAKCKGYWLGIHDKDQDGQFKYLSDNSALEFEKWNSGEPNNGNKEEDCALVAGIPEPEWIDDPCRTLYPYVCEKELEGK